MILALAALSGCEGVPDAVASTFLAAPPAAAPVAPVPQGADALVGVWNVVWDRSATGWSPPRFHGTLIVNADGTVGVDFHESSGDPELRRLDVEGDRFVLEWVWPSTPGARTVIEGRVEGESLVALMKSTGSDGKGVPWSAFSGRRVPILATASAAPAPVKP